MSVFIVVAKRESDKGKVILSIGVYDFAQKDTDLQRHQTQEQDHYCKRRREDHYYTACHWCSLVVRAVVC